MKAYLSINHARQALLLGLLLSLCTCIDDPGAGRTVPASTSSSDQGQVPVVTNSEDGVWAGETLMEVRDALTIGSVHGAAEHEFGRVGPIDVDSRGNVYVLDLGFRRVRKFSPAGRFLVEMGGDGGGPGEFLPGPAGLRFDLGGMAVVGDSLVVVHDPWAWQLVYFALTGEFRKAIRLEADPPPGVFARRSHAVADLGTGGLLMHYVHPVGLGSAATEQDGRHVLVRVSADGTGADTLVSYSQDDFVSRSQSDWHGELFSKPFPSRWHWGVGPSGVIAFGHGSRYEVTVYGPSREPLVRVTRDVDPAPVTQEHIAEFRRAFPFGNGMDDLPPNLRRQATSVLRDLTFPPAWPVFDRLVYDDEGRLWVRRPLLPRDSVAQWDVFDPLNRYLGILHLPAELQVRSIAKGRIYGTSRGEFEVDLVKVLDLVARRPGL